MPKVVSFLVLAMVIFVPNVAWAQLANIANVYDIGDNNAVDGDILISTADKGLVLANTAYDIHLFGILQDHPLVAMKRVSQTGKAVSRYGTAQVNVTTLGGAISAGDYITSSGIAGKGQKATISGYVIGVAMSPFADKDGQTMTYQNKQIASGKVTVSLNFGYAELSGPKSASLFANTFTAALSQNMKDPDKFAKIFQYIAAGFTVFVSFIFGFFTFSRAIPKGIEALGRNPLARRPIMFSIILNIVLTIITAGAGLIGALIIIRL
ncbi:hypothetical protein HY385_00140 [Candidatus Daviesbacteria bacterium]|nr:hypothetical protein [Candidatus Daviesbacteria bacterium]